jgi:hypothetical protein
MTGSVTLSSRPGFEARVVNERSSELERLLEITPRAAADGIAARRALRIRSRSRFWHSRRRKGILYNLIRENPEKRGGGFGIYSNFMSDEESIGALRNAA